MPELTAVQLVRQEHIMVIRKIFIIGGVLLVVLFCATAIFVTLTRHSESTNNRPIGSSTYPQFDVVSGEITPSDAKIIITNINTYTSKKLTSHDFSIRKDTYKKIYTNSGDFTITMLIDTKKPASTYTASITHTNNGDSDNVIVGCASIDEQPSGVSKCVDTYEDSL